MRVGVRVANRTHTISLRRPTGQARLLQLLRQRYTEAELPTSFGPKTGTPEQGIDHTFVLYAGPSRQP